MWRSTFVASLLLLATACPKIEKTVYSFDIAAKTGEVRYLNITSDDPDNAGEDFKRLVATAIDGTQVEDNHPGWHVTSKELVVEDGKLNGVVKFTFDTPAAAGVYKHDKKSPWIWCAGGDVAILEVAGGKSIADVLPGCAAWDRKATRLAVTLQEAQMSGNEASLAPFYERWKAGEEITPPEPSPEETPAEPAPEPAPTEPDTPPDPPGEAEPG